MVARISAKLSYFVSINATFSSNFTETNDIVQQKKQFILEFFQLSMQLYIENIHE